MDSREVFGFHLISEMASKNNTLVGELKSEVLKDRHWKQLMKSMNVSWNLNDLTLGQVWDTDLSKHETTIRDTLIAAQGEKALEEYLRQVRAQLVFGLSFKWFVDLVFAVKVSDLWKSYNLELVNFQNKCKIIRGWDDLFNKAKEHIQSLAAMRMSPYYEVCFLTNRILGPRFSFKSSLHYL